MKQSIMNLLSSSSAKQLDKLNANHRHVVNLSIVRDQMVPESGKEENFMQRDEPISRSTMQES